MANYHTKQREWKNGKSNWTARIQWFQGAEECAIRLNLEDCEQYASVFPTSKVRAEHLWRMFRSGAPKEGERTPFVADLLKLAKRPKGPLHHVEADYVP